MRQYKTASFPPHGEWDRRLREIACPGLAPVELLHRNPWFALNNRGGYFTLEYHQPQVVVIPVVDGRSLVMVRVKRPVLDDTTLELPAGGYEEGEAPADGAARELAEETGITVVPARFVPMPPLAAAPNRNPNLLYVFRVDLEEREFDSRAPHDHEVESVELVGLDDAVKRIAIGEIYVGLVVAVVGSYLLTRRPPS